MYDGLRRRQACMYGHQTLQGGGRRGHRRAVLRPASRAGLVRAVGERPLPGSYYVRLTVVDLPAADLGLPVGVEVRTSFTELGGGHDGDGTLAEPLVPGVSVASAGEGDGRASDAPSTVPAGEPEDGWASGWWTDRWLWTVGGGVLAALAAVFGYSLTRGRGPPGPRAARRLTGIVGPRARLASCPVSAILGPDRGTGSSRPGRPRRRGTE